MRHAQLFVVLTCSLFSLITSSPALAQQARTRVFLNGAPVPVYFNDGDTFRVLEGPLAGTAARLAGFNTLETHGPVHGWSTWSPRELFYIAKMATQNARQGVWHCTSDMRKDGYGRMLAVCPDLVVDQLKKGYAHVMAVGESAPAAYLDAQREAQEARRGIWAKGIPEYILTSTHSATEPFEGDDEPYNRVASTADGRSFRMEHTQTYEICEKVTYQHIEFDPDRLAAALAAMRADAQLGPVTPSYTDDQLEVVLTNFITTGSPGTLQNSEILATFTAFLTAYVASGSLEPIKRSMPVYMIYTPFESHYGAGKASCLK